MAFFNRSYFLKTVAFFKSLVFALKKKNTTFLFWSTIFVNFGLEKNLLFFTNPFHQSKSVAKTNSHWKLVCKHVQSQLLEFHIMRTYICTCFEHFWFFIVRSAEMEVVKGIATINIVEMQHHFKNILQGITLNL